MTTLLAGTDVFQSIQRSFATGPRTSDVVTLLVGICVLLLIVLLASRFLNRDDPRPAGRPDYLTIAVDLLGLSEEVRRDLLYLAERSESEPAVSMLLTPANLAAAAARAGNPDDDPALFQRLNKLSLDLFGTNLPALCASRSKHHTRPAR